MSRLRNADDSDVPEIARMQRKRDQEWEMAGLARADGDMAAAQRHTEAAREWARKIAEALA